MSPVSGSGSDCSFWPGELDPCPGPFEVRRCRGLDDASSVAAEAGQRQELAHVGCGALIVSASARCTCAAVEFRRPLRHGPQVMVTRALAGCWRPRSAASATIGSRIDLDAILRSEAAAKRYLCQR